MAKDTTNELLRRLPQSQLAKILSYAEYAHFNSKELFNQPGSRIRDVFFPETGAIAFVRSKSDFVDIGKEGFLGTSVLLDCARMSDLLICEIDASGWIISSKRFKTLVTHNPDFARLCSLFASNIICQLAKNNECYWHHSLERRCARLILSTQEKVDSKSLKVTQDLLALMLGARRSSISAETLKLEKLGIIQSSRGNIKILEPEKLRSSCCDCYDASHECFDSVFRTVPLLH